MGRYRPNRPPRRIRPEDVKTVEDLYAGLNQVAEDSVAKFRADLLGAGATEKQVDAYRKALVAQTAMRMLATDLLGLWEKRPDATLQQVIFDEIMGKNGLEQATEAFAPGLSDEKKEG
jgi:hypothetical protein